MKAALDQLTALLPKLPDGIHKVKAHYWRGIWFHHKRQLDEAIVAHLASLQLARQQKLRPEEALALINLGTQQYDKHVYEQAEFYFQQALDVAEKNGSWHVLGMALIHLTQIDFVANRIAQAKERLQRAIALFHNAGMQMRLGQPYLYMGLMQMALQDFISAETTIDAALNYYRLQGQQTGEAMALYYQGKTQLAQRKFAQGQQTIQRAIDLAAKVDLLFWELAAVTISANGWLAQAAFLQWKRQQRAHPSHITEDNAAQTDEIAAALNRADALVHDYADRISGAKNPRLDHWLAIVRSRLHLQRADMPQAAHFAEQAYAVSRDFAPRYRVEAVEQLAFVRQAQEAWEQAAQLWQKAFDTHHTLAQPVGVLESQANLAAIALSQNDLATAQPLIEAIWHALNTTPPPVLAGAILPTKIIDVCHNLFQTTNDSRSGQARRWAQRWANVLIDGV